MKKYCNLFEKECMGDICSAFNRTIIECGYLVDKTGFEGYDISAPLMPLVWQEVELSDEQQLAIYMKLKRKQLAEMLLVCNNINKKLIKLVVDNHQGNIKNIPFKYENIKCDGCGCSPNKIYYTIEGTYCENCYRMKQQYKI